MAKLWRYLGGMCDGGGGGRYGDLCDTGSSVVALNLSLRYSSVIVVRELWEW